MVNRGISLSALSRDEEALQCFDKALKVDANHSIIWQKKGDSLRILGRREEAITCYNAALKLEVNNALAWYYKGVCEDEMGQGPNACFSFSQVINLSIGLGSFRFMPGETRPPTEFLRIKPVLIAKEFFDHASARMAELNTKADPFVNDNKVIDGNAARPSESLLSSQTGTPSPQEGSISKAELAAIAGEGKYLNFAMANFLYLKGKSLVDSGKFEEALGSFESALEYHLRFFGATSTGEGLSLFQEGLRLFGKGRPEEALHFFDKGLALELQNENVWGGRAICELKLGRTLDAVHSLNQVLKFADDASKLREFAVACLAELEREANHSSNRQEDVAHNNSQVEPAAVNLAMGHIYQPGDMIGEKYEVRGILGHGGFGVVYLVSVNGRGGFEQPKHGPFIPFALKTIIPEHLADIKVTERFLKEANVWIELGNHSCIVHAYGVDEIAGQLFIWVQYIAPNEQGINSLAGYLKQCPPTLGQSLRWAIQVCYGMEYAYSKGVRAHRDLKPENIMISPEGNALVTDFGLAGIPDASHSRTDSPLTVGSRAGTRAGKTQMGEVFGTPTYMSPEQFTDFARCDERSDIYSFGVVLFQMASGGQLPFDLTGGNWEAWFTAHSQAPVPQLNSPLFPMI